MRLHRSARILASLVTLGFASVLFIAFETRGYVWLLQSDAQHFFGVALDPFGSGTTLASLPGVGTAYRYGRILYPLLAWGLALGQITWIPYTFPLVYLAGVWCLVAMTCDWCVSAGRPSWLGLAAVPVIGATLPHLLPEAWIAVLILWLYRCVLRGHDRTAYGVAVLLLLTRETAIFALAPLVLLALRDRQYRRVLAWSTTVLPLLLWYAWLRVRMGCWPFLDPGAAVNHPLDLPIRGFLAFAWLAPGTPLAAVALAAWLLLALATWVALRTRTLLGSGALAMALIVICFGPGQATMPFEACRLMIPMLIPLVLAILTRPRSLQQRREVVAL